MEGQEKEKEEEGKLRKRTGLAQCSEKQQPWASFHLVLGMTQTLHHCRVSTGTLMDGREEIVYYHYLACPLTFLRED